MLLISGLASAPLAAQGGRVNNIVFGLVNADEDPQAAAESGAGWEIVTFKWDELQPNGPADWNTTGATDAWLDTARNGGREVVGVLVNTPQWATEEDALTGVPIGLYLPISEAGNTWATFIRQAVNYGATKGINRWVIWENVDIPPGQRGSRWDGTPADYYQLLKVAYQTAKQANPNALIHTAGIGLRDSTWFGQLFDLMVDDASAPGNNYYFDVATVHGFYSPDNVSLQTANPFYMMNIRGIPLKPVWINQTNARPAIDPEVYSEDTEFREYRNVTQEQQAAFIIQATALGLAAGAERMAVYRLADDLAEDNGQAFGLVRADGSQRAAYTAYQIVTQEFNGAVYKRRVDEETHPLVEYVRLTFATKVTHVIWSRTDSNATLIIPARSTEAVLVDMFDNRWILHPEGGEYRIAVSAATCNEPSAPSGCMIGGPPLILVEEGVPDPLNTTAPSVTVIAGGTPLTPDPGAILTATAQALPTATPTEIPPTATATTAPIATPVTEEATSVSAAMTEVVVPTNAEIAVAPTDAPPQPTQSPPRPTRRPGAPIGIMAAMPYLLIGLGAVIAVGGATFFMGMWPRRNEQAVEYVDPVWDTTAGEEDAWSENDRSVDGYEE